LSDPWVKPEEEKNAQSANTADYREKLSALAPKHFVFAALLRLDKPEGVV
jgi:hypothetical protein